MNKPKLAIYALAALCLFLAVQWSVLWIKGIEWSPVQSLYRTKPKPQVIAPEAPRKGEELVTLPCVKVEVIQPVTSQPDALEAQSFTLGRWDIPYSRRGGEAEVKLDKDTGKASLTFTPKDMGIVELGRSRYLTLWASYKAQSADVTLSGYSLKLEYEQDMLRIGTLWTRGRLSGGYEKLEGNGIQREGFVVEGSIGVGIGL